MFLEDLVTLDPGNIFRNQVDRGTCVTFGMVAAMEAAYVRDHGVALNLSEQFGVHLNKSTMLPNSGVANYETYPSLFVESTSAEELIGKFSTYSLPLESYAPYWNRSQMDAFIAKHTPLDYRKLAGYNPTKEDQLIFDKMEYSEEYIPRAARENAIYRIKKGKATYLNTASINTFEGYIKARQPVVLIVDWRFKMVDGIHVVDPTMNSLGAHAMLAVGYHSTGDYATSYFIVKNSWGGKEYLKFSYLASKFIHGGVVVEAVEPPTAPVPMTTRWLGYWNVDNDGWRGKLLVRRFEDDRRLGTFYTEDNKLGKAVTADISNNGRTLKYYVFDNWAVKGGNHKGQPFILHQYTWDSKFASGHTVWNKLQYGMFASKEPIPTLLKGGAPPESHFHWSGEWIIYLDGQSGTLILNPLSDKGQISGSLSSRNRIEPVIGMQVKGHPHLADIKIGNRGKIRLMRFTREVGRAAGISTEGPVYGLHAEWISI